VRSKHNPFEHLLSKLLAGGLSAGLVLVWWPTFFSHEGIASWVWRGLTWTLLFELLLGALTPLESALFNSHWARKLRSKMKPQLTRMRGFFPSHPMASGALLAASAIALPAGLIISGSDHIKPVQAAKIIKVTNTKVVKPVKVVKVTKVVKERVLVPGPVQLLPSTSNSKPNKAKSTPATKQPKTKTPVTTPTVTPETQAPATTPTAP
jgi:hypothetical protein